jgi:hypothetical protein
MLGFMWQENTYAVAVFVARWLRHLDKLIVSFPLVCLSLGALWVGPPGLLENSFMGEQSPRLAKQDTS